MEALLSGSGRNIVTARSGADALRELMGREFAVILLDVRMPDMDGFETAALIRERERLRHLPIIFSPRWIPWIRMCIEAWQVVLSITFSSRWFHKS